MPTQTSTIFISTVTDEFKSCRDAAAKWLDRPGTRIETQEKFMALGQTILVKLSEYIRQCDVVVHVVGDRSGNEATGGVAKPATVQHLLQIHPDLPQKLGLDEATLNALTYTQWEAWLAVYHRFEHKNLLLYIAVPSAEAPRDSLLTDSMKAASQRESQQAHLRRLAAHGRYPEISFANSDQLCLGLVGLRDLLATGLRSELAITHILSLSDYRDSLAGFRRFLTQAGLPFQEPTPGHPTHPEELLNRLETSSDARGVLLAGAGGVGKTRTTFETAQLAESRGWRVIYVLPGQPVVTADKVIEAALAHGPGKTMVVIEYLDQMQELDLGVLRRHLIQASHQRGIEFGIIANCRPGLLLKHHPERDACFDIVRLEPTTEEAHRLSVYVATRTAPKARGALGDTELMRLCGHRPIIALLVAQQLEQLAATSRIVPENLSAVRTGDLGHWLRRRLAEDKLITPEPESIYDPASPPPHLVAAAAALACAPDEELALIAAAEQALVEIGKPASTAGRIIGVLREVGWLEPEGPWLNVVHDVVADELMEQSVFELNTVRNSELRAILIPGTARARSLGRISKTATRVAGALSPIRLAGLHASLSEWLNTHAKGLGGMLADAEPDSGAYALGAVLGGSALEDGAVEHWRALVAPWIECYGARYEARHLLFRGLRTGRESVWNALLGACRIWLESWRSERVASFVLGPLLYNGGERPSPEFPIVQWSLQWLEAFTDKSEAGYVLAPLLSREDVRGEQAGQVVKLALQWLEAFADKSEAGYVLAPLLGREDVRGEQAAQSVKLALQWLEAFTDKSEARYVLAPLLGREDARGEQAGQVVKLALQWLEAFADKPEAGYVLAPLLGREDVRGEQAGQVVKLALQWLEAFADKSEAGYVLAPLLGREDVRGEQAAQAEKLALQWLEAFAEKPEAGYVLAPLLGREDVRGEQAGQAVKLALQWLEAFTDKSEARYVLAPLLGREDARGEQAGQVVKLALQWLEAFTDKSEARYVLAPLLGREDARGEQAGQVVKLALQWLEAFADESDADYVFKRLLGREDVRGEQAGQAVKLALEWLEAFADKTDADYVFKALLGREDVRGEQAAQAEKLALQWLEAFAEKPEAGYVLAPLLGREDVSGEQAGQAVKLALQWLEAFADKPEAGYVLAPLLGREDVRGEQAAQAVKLALQWLEAFTGKPDADYVFKTLLGREDVRGEQAVQAVKLALQWLEAFTDKSEARYVLEPLLGREDVRGEQAAQAVKLALQWLEAFGRDSSASFVLGPLLRFTLPACRDKPEEAQIAGHTATWLTQWGKTVSAGYILLAWHVTGWSEFVPIVEITKVAKDWVQVNRKVGSGGPAIAISTALCPFDSPNAVKIISKAQSWLFNHKLHPSVGDVLCSLLAHCRPGGPLVGFIADMAIHYAWHRRESPVCKVLARVLTILNADDHRKEEIEVILEGRT